MKFRFTRWGMAASPIGAQVALTYGGRALLGDVVGVYRDDVRGITHLKVRHFNGEPWPIEPAAIAVEVLERAAR